MSWMTRMFFLKHHPSGQYRQTAPVTVNLCRDAMTWHLQHEVNLYFHYCPVFVLKMNYD